jgi:hypothetical protein
MTRTDPEPLFIDRAPVYEPGNPVAEVACPCGGRAPRYYHGALYHLSRCSSCGRTSRSGAAAEPCFRRRPR